MPINVQHNVISGTRLTEEDGVVTEYVDLHVVHGFEFNANWANSQPDRPLFAAMMQTPQAGDPHPRYTDLVVRRKVPRAEGFNLVFVEVTYRFPDATSPGFENTVPEFGGGVSLEQIETAFDFLGNRLRVGTIDTDTGQQIDVDTGVASVFTPVGDLQASLVQQSTIPWFVARPWIRTVNGGPWFWDPVAQARTWMIAAIPFTLVSNQFVPPLFRFTFQFRYRPETWDPIIYYVDPKTGQPPDNLDVEPSWVPLADPAPGIRRPTMYPAVDFNNLPFF